MSSAVKGGGLVSPGVAGMGEGSSRASASPVPSGTCAWGRCLLGSGLSPPFGFNCPAAVPPPGQSSPPPSLGWARRGTRWKGAVGEAPGPQGKERPRRGVRSSRKWAASAPGLRGTRQPPSRSPPLAPGAVLRRPLLAEALPATVSGLSRGASTVCEYLM